MLSTSQPAEHIQYRGWYAYADRSSLERALTAAKDSLDEEDLTEAGAWLRFFVSRGTNLTVNLVVPDCSEHRFAAANVFLQLAYGATDGHVDALIGADHVVDSYSAGTDEE